MKRTRKALMKILAAALTLCLLFAAFPAASVSAATVRFIGFDYDSRYGLVRTSDNREYVEVGSAVLIYVFPNDGCVIDSVVITDVTNNRVINADANPVFEGGTGYTFMMPNGDIKVAVVFNADNANGYYKVNCDFEGDGSVSFSKNGFITTFYIARAGDTLRYSDPVAGEGYTYEYGANNDYYINSAGEKTKVRINDPFSMPASDITITVCFERLYDIRIVASGGTATSHVFGYALEYDPDYYIRTEATEETVIAVLGKPDENHLDEFKFKVISDSGKQLSYAKDKAYSVQSGVFDYLRFRMPADSVTAYVTFLKENYDVACSAENGSLGFSAPEGTGAGRRVTLLPAPDEGFGIKELYYTYTPEVGSDEVRMDVDLDDPAFYMPEADVSVTAVFAPLCRVQWLDGDESILDEKNYVEGTAIPETDKIPVKESTWECEYEFAGWSAPAYYTGRLAVIRPVFDKVYSVLADRGTAQPSKARAGTPVTLTPDEAPEGMYFSGWKVLQGDVEVSGNSFVMPASHVSLYAEYRLKKSAEIDLVPSEEKGFVGKPFSVSGTVSDNDEILDVGGTVTITFSNGAPGEEGAVGYTVPVENGSFLLNVPALTAGSRYIWAEYSGFGEYGTALISQTLAVYELSAAGLDGFYGESGVKTRYNAGEALNTDNLILWLYWMDGTEEELAVTPGMVSGFDSEKPGQQTLTVACPYPCPDDADLTYEVIVIGLMRGDANGDGKINVRDVTAIQRHLSETEPLSGLRLKAADVNLDGRVDIDDVTVLQRYLAEFDIDFNIGMPVE